VWEDGDYLGRVIRITVYFNNSTRALNNSGPGSRCVIIHRDTGCAYNTIVFDNPTDSVKAKRLAAPVDGAGDKTYTVNQVRNASKSADFPNGWQTFEDTQTVQISAEF
jgi:hypothetical protein